MKKLATLVGLTLALGCTNVMASDQSVDESYTSSASAPSADNTGMNVRDKDGTTPTPQTQSNASEDRNLLAAVRRAVVDEESFSTLAHNVKIMVQDGVVMLRGPVESEAEKNKIERLAQEIKGVARVDNQLDIKKP